MMIDLPPELIVPEKPAFVMPAPAIIHSEEWWKANLPGMIPGLAFMAGKRFPRVEAWTSGTAGSNNNHTVNWPSGVISGELLVAFIGLGSDRNSSSSGITELWDDTQNNNNGYWGGYHIATASHASFTINFSGNTVIVYITMRISGYSGTPEHAGNKGTSANANPNSVTPTWGAENTLWVASMTVKEAGAPTGVPTGYTDSGEAPNLSGAYTLASTKRLRTATEDPGAWTHSSGDWLVRTVAVQPA